MKKIVLDTSIIIDYTRGKGKTLVKLLKLQEEKKAKLIVSAVTIFEFYSGSSLEDKDIYHKTDLLFSKFDLMEANEEIAKLAAEINRCHQLYKKVSTADLLIGATSLYCEAFLVTNNFKDFNLIPGIKILTDDPLL